MTAFLGVDKDWWLIILTAIIVIETLVLIFLAIRARRVAKGEIDPNHLVKLIEKALEKIPTPLDTKQPPAVPSNKIEELEEKIKLISKSGTSLRPEFLIKLGNVEYTKVIFQKP